MLPWRRKQEDEESLFLIMFPENLVKVTMSENKLNCDQFIDRECKTSKISRCGSYYLYGLMVDIVILSRSTR
jgi:hypothetical protein